MYQQQSSREILPYQRVISDRIMPWPAWRILYCLLVILLSGYLAQPILADNPLVTQEFQYHMPEAGEVYLVWGVNGWQLTPEETRPMGTVVQEQVMHTPMTLKGD